MKEKVRKMDKEVFVCLSQEDSKKIDRDEFAVLTKAVLELYKKSNKQIINIIKDFIVEEIEHRPSFSKLRRYYGSNYKKEIISLAYEVMSEDFKLCEEWLKDYKSNNYYPSILHLLNRKISEILSKQKEKDRYEWLGERLKGQYAKDDRDLIEEAEDFTIEAERLSFTISPEDRKEKWIIKELKSRWEILHSFLKRTGIPNADEEFKNFLNSYAKREDLKKEIENISKAKSIYQLAKEKGVDYRKLLYTLKTIHFPIRKMHTRKGFIVTKKYLSLFEKIFPIIQQMWRQEANYKNWIKYFKKKGWRKDRISHFMERRIKYGVVPPFFFDIVPPPPTPKFLSKLIKKDKNIMKIFEILSKMFPLPENIDFTHKGIKEKLSQDLLALRKTLLTQDIKKTANGSKN